MKPIRKIKSLLFLGLSLLIVSQSNAQSQTEIDSSSALLTTEEVKTPSKQILVIPFQPSMYYVNNDAFICKASNMNPGELNKHIRASLTSKVTNSLSENWKSASIKDEPMEKAAFSDAEEVYRNLKYSTEKKPLIAFYKNYDEKNSKNLWGLTNDKSKNAPKYLNPKEQSKAFHNYYKAEFRDFSKLSDMSKRYNVSSFLIFTHFEMETHFKDCTALQEQVSKRDIYVHFTVLDSEGRHKDGGVVCLSMHSETNNIRDILKTSLPSISEMIMTQIKPIL